MVVTEEGKKAIVASAAAEAKKKYVGGYAYGLNIGGDASPEFLWAIIGMLTAKLEQETKDLEDTKADLIRAKGTLQMVNQP